MFVNNKNVAYKYAYLRLITRAMEQIYHHSLFKIV